MTIDWWTLGIQTVNVAVLIWLLHRFFWRPVAGMIEQRRVAAQSALSDAQAKRTQAEAALADIERTRAGFAKEHDAMLADASKAAESAGATRRAQVDAEIATAKAAATAAAAREKDEAEAAWAERSSRLAVDIAGRLAGRLDGPAAQAAFLDWLTAAIRALPVAARQAAAESGAALEVVSASDLDAAEQAHVTEAICAAFDAHPSVSYRIDPGLIAGLELHGAHLIVDNSWRADLAGILAGLAHARRH